MSHTPGPWKAAKDSYGVMRIWSPQNDDIASTCGDGSLDEEEREANTRLIAAAPDLLAACKLALAFVEPLAVEGHPNPALTLNNQLCAAIAQAEQGD